MKVGADIGHGRIQPSLRDLLHVQNERFIWSDNSDGVHIAVLVARFLFDVLRLLFRRAKRMTGHLML